MFAPALYRRQEQQLPLNYLFASSILEHAHLTQWGSVERKTHYTKRNDLDA